MVLGLKTRNKKGASIQVDYLVHVQEIKPWSLSQSPGSILSLLLRWENGDKNSGSIGPVVPSFESGSGDAKIEFNESFRLMATLSREAPAKGGDGETFQKNYLEFSLYESRREKTVRGKLLGTVLIDLAEYGIVNEIVNIGAPMNCKRSFRNTDQPVLFVRIQPFGKDNSSSSLREILSKESSQEKNEKESISTLMSEEHSEELEIASFTDDDVSSHSSFGMPSSAAAEAGGSSPPQNLEVPEKSEEKPLTFSSENVNGNSCLSSIDLSSDPGSPENDHASSSKFPWSSLSLIPRESVSHSFQSFSSYIADEDIREETRPGNSRLNYGNDNLTHKAFHEKSGNEENRQNDVNTKDLLALFSPSDTGLKVVKKTGFVDYSNSHTKEKNNVHTKEQNRNETANADDTCGPPASPVGENGDWEEQGENGVERQIKKEKLVMAGGESSGSFSSDSTKKQVSYPGFTRSLSRRSTGVRWNAISDDKKSIPSSLDLPRSNGLLTDNKLTSKVKEIDVLKDVDTGSRSFIIDEVKDATLASRDTRNSFSDGKVQHLEHKIERLEVELKEAAAIEIGLYSVVAEHGSSASKIHSPARRVSRLYLHALRECLPARISSAARSAVSGLVLVAKACGNDVPRLTFWLSNLIVLRAVINQAIEESQLSVSASSHIENDGGGKGNSQRSSTFNWKESSPTMREKKLDLAGYSDDWENPHTFTSVLEKIEAWIFSRIVESVWWQTLTPHMQSTNGEASDKNCGSGSKKCYGRKSSLIDQEQGNLSVELWKKAIKDAYERLCPVRAEGHECGCLPVLVRLVMEQCVARLDVAMFNAILRESGDEIPTDPVSDPISDTKVLPIPVGKASFGAGAQLKNSVGSWSRWLTDLLGIDDDDLPEGKKLDGGYRHEFEASFKPFNLLNALSDLMMLPKDLLLSSAIRKEVCPAFGAALIQRVLNIFVPDEFCPDPIPEALFQALDSECLFQDSLLAEGQSIQKFPCTAAPVVYVPPPAASVAGFIGSGSQSQLLKRNASILQKSNTSDDELDELDSPLASILGSVLGSHTSSTSSTWKSKKSGVHNVIRYQLLREAWRDYA